MAKQRATVGVSDHCGWAVLMTVTPDGTLIDRRRVELVDDDLPKMPHHHEAQELPMKKGVQLVGRVRASAERCAKDCLDALAEELDLEVQAIAIRRCPSLPPTVEERISNYQAQARADGVMYRVVLADAAEARGWLVDWYDPKAVFDQAAEVLGTANLDDHLAKTGKSVGRPWQKDHKMAMAAAIAAGPSTTEA